MDYAELHWKARSVIPIETATALDAQRDTPEPFIKGCINRRGYKLVYSQLVLRVDTTLDRLGSLYEVYSDLASEVVDEFFQEEITAYNASRIWTITLAVSSEPGELYPQRPL